jgi:tripartite-type tricarboxylate transporter receptor subunit TctC
MEFLSIKSIAWERSMKHVSRIACVLAGMFASALLAPLLWLSQPATAQTASGYPNRMVKFIVPLAPGGVADVMSRMVAEHLQTKLGQPFVVENRPGAGTAIGMDAVAKSAPDGYTIGMGNIAANAINPAFQPERVPYDPVKDFSPISLVGITPSMLVINAEKVPSKTLPEFIAYLKANPGKLTYGSSGVGTSLHIGMELFMQKSGTKMVHVPYRGSAPMLTDLIGGQIDVALDAASTSLQHVQSGKLRALGITTPERAFFAPELAPLADTVPGVVVSAWHGMMAPAGTPPAIIKLLQDEIQAFLRLPATEAKLREQGVVRVGNSSVEFGAFMITEFDLYKKVIAEAGIKAP